MRRFRRACSRPRQQDQRHRSGVGRRPRGRAHRSRAARGASARKTGCWPRRARSSTSESGRRWVVDPARRHGQLPLRHPAGRGQRRARGRAGRARGRGPRPRARETFRAVRGGGAELNGVPIQVSGCDRLERALVATGFSYDSRAPRGVQAERARARAAASARHPPRRRRGARPVPGWPPGASTATTSAAAQALGLGRGPADRHRGRRRRAGAARRRPPGLVAADPVLLPELAELSRPT